MKNDRRLIRIGHLSTVYHTSFILMGTTLLKDMGIEATWTLFPSGPDIVNAMREGQIDLGYIGLPSAMIGIDKGTMLVCIAGGHTEGTVMIAGEGIQALDQCAGMTEFLAQFTDRQIGCPPRGSIHDVIVNELLTEHGSQGRSREKLCLGRFPSRCPDRRGDSSCCGHTGPCGSGTEILWHKDCSTTAQVVAPQPKLWHCSYERSTPL